MIFKTLPSIISSINQLGEASNKLKAINFSMVGLNSGNLDAYRNAISGISKEQAALLLSTQGLNQAHIDLVLSNEKVTASEIAEAATLDGVAKKKSILTVEQQKQLVSSQALTTEKLAEISATLGLETAENGSLISKKALNAEMVKQQLESIGVVGSTQAQIMNMLGLTTAETSAATASNVLSGAMAKLSLAMSTNPIGALITVIGIAVVSVYGLTKAFDALTDSAEEIDERVDDLISKYNDLKTTADNNASTVESLADEYESLSKGVNDLGENVSLTSEEYARYNEIVNQIADMFPTLITGYTDEGTAILSLKGNVEQLRDAYKEAQQEAYNLLVATGKDSDGNDIMESYKNLSELDWWDSSIGAEDVTTTVKRDITKQILDLMSNMDTAVEEYDKLAQTIFDTYGDKGYNFLEEMGLPAIKDVFSDTSGITEEALIAGRATVQSYYQGFQSEIDTKLSKVKLMANAFLNTNDFYLDDSTNSELKNALSVMVNSIDEELANSFNGEQVKVGAYVNNIVNSIKGNEEVQKELIDLFTIDTTDMPVSDIAEQINGYITSIAIAINEDPEELKVRLGFDYVNDIEAQYQRAVDFAKDKFDGYDPTAFFNEHSINTQEEIDAWQKIVQGARDAAEAEKEYLNQGREQDSSPTLSISQTIDQLNTQLKPAFDSLQSAYQDIFTDDGKFALNSIDILSTCDTIKSKLDEMSNPEGLNLDVDYSAFEDFVRVLNNTESTEQDVENAFDSLATSITQAALSGAEDFETMKAALEDLGVVNNEMVAFDNLISKTNALADAGIDLANATETEMQAFVNESVSAENAGEALALLHLKKALVNQETITTAADCQNILTLAQAANVGIAYLEQLNTLMNLITQRDSAQASGDSRAVSELNRAIRDFSSNIVNNLNLDDVKVDFTPIGSGAKSAGGKAGKDYKDALKEQLSDLDSVISGITGRIDEQISSINEQKSAALESIDAQKEAIESAKESAVEALEEERDARLEVIETQKAQLEEQIKLIEKQIKSKQDEIDRINEAAEARAREISLQEKQYALEQKRNQRTKLVYTESSGMIYRPDEQGIRKAKEEVDDAKRQIEIANIQKEIDLLEDQKDLLNEQIDLLDERADAINNYYDEQIKQTEKFYDAQIKALEKQRKSTESYFESLITNLENSKSKYQELTEILEKAELSAKLKQLGIDEEALLNGSEEEFNKLKDAYMNIVFQLNQGNDEVLSSLRELSGYEGTAPSMLEDSNGKLDEMNGRLNTSNQTIGTVNSSLGETAVKTSDAATNVSDLNENLSQINTIISEEQTAFETLRQKIDEIITAINEKIVATYTGQAATAIATTTEMACYMLLRDKILEVKEHLDAVNNTAITLDVTPVNALTTAFQLLYDQLLLVSTTLGAGMEGAEEGAVGGIASAIQALNEISLEEGIIAQFTNLKTAIDEVTSAIGGGGDGNSEGSAGGQSSGGESGGGKYGGKGSKGEGGGGDSLTGAIESMGETAKEVIGEPDAEGDGTVIGEFSALETAVTDVTSAIGGGESEGGEGQGKGSGSEGEDGEGTLIGSIENLGETTEEVLGEPGGEGVIGRFEKFKEPIQEAETHVKGISTGLDEIDGKEVECTIKVNIEVSGSTGFTGSAKVLGSMNLNSAEYNAKYTGASHAEGTAMVSGNWAVQSDEQNALVGEVGRELIVRGGRFFTVGDNGAEMFDIKKGDIVFNHEQTEDLLKHGHISGRGKAYADGTVGGGKILTKDSSILRPLQPGDKMYDLVQKFDAYFKSMDGNLEKLVPNSFYEQNREWNKMADQISYANSVVNNRNVQPIINVGGVNVTCPGVTSQEVMKEVGDALGKQIGHLAQRALQEPLHNY